MIDPIGLASQLAAVEAQHPELATMLVGAVKSAYDAVQSGASPTRAVVRHIMREIGEGPLASELADELGKLVSPDASRVT